MSGWAAAGAAAAGIGSNFINFWSNNRTNSANRKLAEQQNQWNLQYQQNEFRNNQQAAQTEYERNLEMWNLQNEYNSPSAQMQRYIDAGLNLNLIYGTGSASAGNASSSPEFHAARYSAPKAERSQDQAPRFELDPYQLVSISNQLGIQEAQINHINAQADFTKQQARNASVDEQIKLFESNFKKDNKDNLYDQLYHSIQNQQADTNLKWVTSELNRAKESLTMHQEDNVKQMLQNLRTDNDFQKFRLELEKLGINSSDNALLRIAARIVADPESKISKLIKTLF